MADKTKVEVSVVGEKTYALELLRANCNELFGVSDATFAGATNGMSGRFSRSEIAAKIAAWGREVVK